MTDRPIIFSAPMVNALLDGRKGQTRRVLTLKGYPGMHDFGPSTTNGFDWHFRRRDKVWCDVREKRLQELLPYTVGDRMYVREAWSHTGDGVWEISSARMAGRSGVIYAADGKVLGAKYWPSIHMPREFSRLTLLVTDVRVQRVQDISEDDAKAEGVRLTELEVRNNEELMSRELLPHIKAISDKKYPLTLKTKFYHLWSSLHTEKPKRWKDNPWVVAVSFDVQHSNIDDVA